MTGRMERVILLLRTGRSLCSYDDFYLRALPNGRNAVSTLRSRGWEIESTFRIHEEGREAHSHYRLISEPGREPVQRLLGVA